MLQTVEINRISFDLWDTKIQPGLVFFFSFFFLCKSGLRKSRADTLFLDYLQFIFTEDI